MSITLRNDKHGDISAARLNQVSLRYSTPQEDCCLAPWGSEGWKGHYSQRSYRYHLRCYRLDTPKWGIEYTVNARECYEQAKSCTWCRLLYLNPQIAGDDLVLRHLWPTSWKDQLTRVVVQLKPLTAEHVAPKLLNEIEVSCWVRVHPERGFTSFHLDLGVFTYPSELTILSYKIAEDGRQKNVTSLLGSPASAWFFSPSLTTSFSSGFDEALARKWINECQNNRLQPYKCMEYIRSALPGMRPF